MMKKLLVIWYIFAVLLMPANYLHAGELVEQCGDINGKYADSLDRVNAISECLGKVSKAVEEKSLIPPGTIVAWYAIDKPVPDGWLICDGTNGTPDLRGKFLRGVATMADSGNDANASDTHTHGGSTAAAPEHAAGTSKGNDDTHWSIVGHRHAVSISGASNIPPNFRVVYLMKK